MARAGALTACAGVLLLAGCGGGGSSSKSYTYVVAASSDNIFAQGIYLTVVSPVPIPTKLLTKGGGKIVSQAQGPQKCSYYKTVQGSRGPGAFLSGKTLTVKVNGTSSFTKLACEALKKTPLKASKLGS